MRWAAEDVKPWLNMFLTHCSKHWRPWFIIMKLIRMNYWFDRLISLHGRLWLLKVMWQDEMDRDRGSHPESSVGSGLDLKITLVRERSWFWIMKWSHLTLRVIHVTRRPNDHHEHVIGTFSVSILQPKWTFSVFKQLLCVVVYSANRIISYRHSC